MLAKWMQQKDKQLKKTSKRKREILYARRKPSNERGSELSMAGDAVRDCREGRGCANDEDGAEIHVESNLND